MMRIGFTGTRNGMTPEQRIGVSAFLFEQTHDGYNHEFHHGGCKGADVGAAKLARRMWGKPGHIVRHPGRSANGSDEWEAERDPATDDDVRQPKGHFARNRDIVDETETLIATPWQKERPAPKSGGGTWYTIEYAEKQGKRVCIIWPDGRMDDRLGRESE